MSYLIVGAGYIGGALARALVPAEVSIVRRRPDLLEGVRCIQADLLKPATLDALPRCEHLIYAAAPDQASEESYRAIYLDGLRHVLEALQRKNCQPRVYLTSSTSVYAENEGSWVDEATSAVNQTGMGRLIAEGERYLLDGPWISKIVRFGGIYGPGRTYFLRRVLEKKEVIFTGPPQYTNRIHQADAVGILLHLLQKDRSGQSEIYNGVDSEVADRNEVIFWMAELLGIDPGDLKTSDDRGQVQHRGHKRVSNKKILDAGYRFQFPSYREGYTQLLAEVQNNVS